MRKLSKSSAKFKMFRPEEYIRIAPLHYPKPSVALDDVGRIREDEGADLFDGQPHPAAASPQLTYNGGPLIPNVRVFTIFWGKLWGKSPSSTAMMQQLNQFFAAILASPLMDQLAEYNVPGQSIGDGSFIGTTVISTNAPAQSITDSAIQAQIQNWINAGTVPDPNPNSLYFIYLDPNIVSIMGGSKSCQSYCGYHNNVGKIYYAVMPYPTCSGCLGGMTAFEALTGTSSHELCEAITDPVPGQGWYDQTNGEIGDICAWNFKTVAGYTVQLEWSNKQNKCV